jgi:branched-chain amino acid transport system substrate-binding protein
MPPSPFGIAGHSYDAVLLLAAAIKQAGSTDGEKIKAALENLNTPVEGVMKTYNKPFSATVHEGLSSGDYRFVKWKDGKFAPYTDATIKSLTPADYKK